MIYKLLAPLDVIHHEIHELLDAPVYAVGGCVRDCLLERPVQDYDFATPLHPNDIEERLCAHNYKVLPYGKRFGTVCFKHARWGVIEITSFRGEQYVYGSRHPHITFSTSLRDDIMRRDFTVNALAYDGSLHDYVCGIDDMHHKLLRFVGTPEKRITEDPLRALRALRFCAQLNFNLEEHSLCALATCHKNIALISAQRIYQEVQKLLECPQVEHAYSLMLSSGLARFILPELALIYMTSDVTVEKFVQNFLIHEGALHTHNQKCLCRLAYLLHRYITMFYACTPTCDTLIYNACAEQKIQEFKLRFKWSNKYTHDFSQLFFGMNYEA